MEEMAHRVDMRQRSASGGVGAKPTFANWRIENHAKAAM
jgi:hypothetical protein